MDTRLWIAGVLAWCASAYLANLAGVGPVYVIICCNLGQRKSAREVSAYSVFNKGYARVPGALTVGQIDAQLRHTGEEDADEGVQTTGVVDASFTGSGQRLGRSGEGQPWWARALDELERRGRSLLAPSRSSGARAPGPDIDPTLPTLSLRIRLAGAPGEHTVTMNTTHTVQDLFCTVKEIAARERGAQPGRRTALLAGFPPARLDPAATTTLQDAGLASALVREVVEHG